MYRASAAFDVHAVLSVAQKNRVCIIPFAEELTLYSRDRSVWFSKKHSQCLLIVILLKKYSTLLLFVSLILISYKTEGSFCSYCHSLSSIFFIKRETEPSFLVFFQIAKYESAIRFKQFITESIHHRRFWLCILAYNGHSTVSK